MVMPTPQRIVEPSGTTWSFSVQEVGKGVNLGYRFQVSEPIYIVSAGWFQHTSDVNAHGASLDVVGAEVRKIACWLPSPIIADPPGFKWVHRNIKPGWLVEPGTVYDWEVWFSDISYGFSHGVLATDLTVGPVTILRDLYDGTHRNGVFVYGVPFQDASNLSPSAETLYAVDFGFQLA
jgi:hypothetical protein